VELRLKTGRILRGQLKTYAGKGTNRMAIVATENETSFIYLHQLDVDTRVRMDPLVRENFIRRQLNLPPVAPDEPIAPRTPYTEKTS
jgi:hypothetical protein